MKYQMIEYQKLINQLRAVRSDLSEKTITQEVQKLAATTSVNVLDVLRHCIRLGVEGRSMPWEIAGGRMEIKMQTFDEITMDEKSGNSREEIAVVRLRIYNQGSEFCVIAEIDIEGKNYRESTKSFQTGRGIGRALKILGQQILDDFPPA